MSDSSRPRSRRDFLKAGSALAGLTALPVPLSSLAATDAAPDTPHTTAYKYPNPGRIVIVEHPNAVSGYNNVNAAVVQSMFDEGIMQLTGITSSPAAALASLFPGLTTSKKIAIKPNLINSSVPTRKELLKAVITRLVQMLGGFPAANITVYERHSMSAGGYSQTYFGQQVNLVVDSSFPNLGYTILCNGKNRPYSKSLYEADYLINMPVAKDHSCGSGLNFTLSFKNHMGTVNPGGSLGIHCDKTAVMDIMASSVMVTKQRLVILDALYAIYNGGPSGSPQASPKKIMLSQDPVTIDAQGRILLNALRTANRLSAKSGTYIDEAAATPYEIGIADPALMTVIPVLLPVRLTLFTAFVENEKVRLRWATESETNNTGFGIERSRDEGATWMQIAFAKGAGTTTVRQEYSYLDEDAGTPSSPLLYRLKQIDTDGREEYSPTVEVRTEPVEDGWTIDQNYPNPFSGSTDIPVTLPRSTFLHLEVIDTKGGRVAVLCDRVVDAGQSYFTWEAKDVAAGVYICRGTAEGRTIQIQLINVQ